MTSSQTTPTAINRFAFGLPAPRWREAQRSGNLGGKPGHQHCLHPRIFGSTEPPLRCCTLGCIDGCHPEASDLSMSLWRWKKYWTHFRTKRFRNLFCSHWDSAWCMSPMKLQMKTWNGPSMPYRFKLKLCFQQLCNTAVSGPGLTKLKIFKPFSNQSIPHFGSFGKLLPIPSCPPFNLGWLRHTPIIASGVPQDSHHLRFAKCFRCHTENQAIQASTRATLRTEARILRANKMLESFAVTATLLIWEENTQELTIHSDLIEVHLKFLIVCFNCLRAKTVCREGTNWAQRCTPCVKTHQMRANC